MKTNEVLMDRKRMLRHHPDTLNAAFLQFHLACRRFTREVRREILKLMPKATKGITDVNAH